MSLIRLFSVFLLILFISFGAIGGCGGGDEDNNGESSGNGGELAGEQNCTDGIDNDGDTEIDCEDIDCILDPACMVEDTPEDTTPDTPTLNEPINNQTITQNNPDIGCPFDPFFGFGSEIFFDWTDSEASSGISGYQLFVIGPGAIFPIVDTFVTESEFTFTSCNSFVIDSNLMGWEWNVQAVSNEGKLINQGKLGEVSEDQTFQFEPCRFQDGTGCGGQPPTEPPAGDDDDMVPPPPDPSPGQSCESNGFCRVFITSTAHSINFGGVAGADAICQNLADTSPLTQGGRYLAWISDSLGNSPSTRFNQVSVPYQLTSGTHIANSYSDLITCNPFCLLANLSLDENSNFEASRTFTGTATNGNPTGSDCVNWTNTAGNGTGGVQTITAPGWTSGLNLPCSNTQSFYCFEQ